jgi:hypothetical protein
MAQQMCAVRTDGAESLRSTGPPARGATGAQPVLDVSAVLQRQCEDLTHLSARGVTVTCVTGHVQLVRVMASEILWVARQLINGAWHAFRGGNSGRIAVELRLDGDTLELTVEHSRPRPKFRFGCCANDATLIRTTVTGFGGRLEDREVIGGVRTVVMMPVAEADHSRGRVARNGQRGNEIDLAEDTWSYFTSQGFDGDDDPLLRYDPAALDRTAVNAELDQALAVTLSRSSS